MRVTDRMIFDTATLNAAKSRDRAQSAMEEVSTGMRVQHPGDDPAVAAAMVRGRQVVDRLDAINQNAGRAGGEVDLFVTLQSLSTALNSNNGNGIRGALTNIDSATTQVTTTLAKVGSMGDAFATAQTLATETRDATIKTVSTQSEADIFAAS